MSGPLPAAWNVWSSLKTLRINGGKFGTLPSEWGSWDSLRVLDLVRLSDYELAADFPRCRPPRASARSL